MVKITMVVVAVALAAAAPVQGQGTHQHGAAGEKPMMMKHGEGEQMNHAADPSHRFAPGMLLEHRAGLKLTAAQVQQLEALNAKHEGDCHPRMQAAQAAETAAAEALTAAVPDIARYEAKLREAAELKIVCKVDMVRTGQQARALLTPEQLQHLEQMSSHGNH